MKKEELIGKKVRGFKFEGTSYNPRMEVHIGEIGEIIEYKPESNVYGVQFKSDAWYYPAERIEHHLVVDEEPTIEELEMSKKSLQSALGLLDEANKYPMGSIEYQKLHNEAIKRLDEIIEEAKIKAKKGVNISFESKSSKTLKLQSLNESCIDYGKTEYDPLDDLPIIGDGVLMEVSDDGKVWHERNVVGKLKNNSFLAISDNGPAVYCWNFAQPIAKTKITRKEFESKFEIID